MKENQSVSQVRIGRQYSVQRTQYTLRSMLYTVHTGHYPDSSDRDSVVRTPYSVLGTPYPAQRRPCAKSLSARRPRWLIPIALIAAVVIWLPSVLRAQPGPVYVPQPNPPPGGYAPVPQANPFSDDGPVATPGLVVPSPYGVLVRPSDDSDDPQARVDQQEAAALVQKFTFLQHLQRSPALVLRNKALQAAASAKPEKPAKPEAEKNPDAVLAKQFSDDFVAGDWKRIRAHLKGLPKDAGSKVYGFLLMQLASGKNLVLPDDVLDLADAAPADFDSLQLAMLGRMLQQSQARLGIPLAMLQRLREGTERLGGKDPARRLAAARLLVAADMIDEARTYLPPMAEVLQQKDPRTLNLVALCEMQAGVRHNDKQAIRKAWDLTGIVLATPQAGEENRTEAMQRAIALLPLMPEEQVAAWIKMLAEKQRPLCMLILAESAQMAENSFRSRATELRVQAVSAQHRLVKGLLGLSAKDRAAWSETIRMMTLGWLNEANYSINTDNEPEDSPRAAVDPQNYPQGRYVPASSYGGQTAGLPGPWPTSRMRRDRGGNNEPLPLDAKTLLPLSPEEDWCQAVDADMARQMRRLTAIVAAETGDRTRAFAGIRACGKDDPKLARQLAEQYLGNWLASLLGRSPDSSSNNNPYSSGQAYRQGPGGVYSVAPYSGSPYNPGSSGGVPLIRARQVRNLAALADELKAIRDLGAPPVREELIAAAFDACHSPAEVYREEDLRQVFGAPASFSPELVLQLVSTMRTKLVGQWAKPEVQEQAGTQRTDKDQIAEILRGYALAETLLAAAQKQAPGKAEVVALRAAVVFDQSEFLYGQKADLKTYTTLRDLAFAEFGRAADLYAKVLPSLPPEQQLSQVYMRWFQSALGASDLAYLTRQDKPDADQIERVAAAIRRLGEKPSARHLQMFGEMVTASMSEVPPQLKPYYLRSAMRVLGDHPAGNAARERLKFYDELLGEVQLHVQVDGSSQVGHGQSFARGFPSAIPPPWDARAPASSTCFRRPMPTARKPISPKSSNRRSAKSSARLSKSRWSASTIPRARCAASAGPAGWKPRWLISSCGPRPVRSTGSRRSPSIWISMTVRAWCGCRWLRRSC